MSQLLKPLIPQRADPFVYKHTDGYYYFTASVPKYDRIELRRAKTIAELANAPTVDAWHKPDSGPYSELVWAPEIHFNKDPQSGESAWYVYFAAAPSREIKHQLFQHRTKRGAKNSLFQPVAKQSLYCSWIGIAYSHFQPVIRS